MSQTRLAKFLPRLFSFERIREKRKIKYERMLLTIIWFRKKNKIEGNKIGGIRENKTQNFSLQLSLSYLSKNGRVYCLMLGIMVREQKEFGKKFLFLIFINLFLIYSIFSYIFFLVSLDLNNKNILISFSTSFHFSFFFHSFFFLPFSVKTD